MSDLATERKKTYAEEVATYSIPVWWDCTDRLWNPELFLKYMMRDECVYLSLEKNHSCLILLNLTLASYINLDHKPWGDSKVNPFLGWYILSMANLRLSMTSTSASIESLCLNILYKKPFRSPSATSLTLNLTSLFLWFNDSIRTSESSSSLFACA